MRESWQQTFGGARNGNKVAVLEEGMKYTPISVSPEQAQFLETRKFQLNEIARIFRIPPHMIGDLEKSSFSNIEQQSLEFVKYTLDPWVVRWEQAITKTLLNPREKQQLFVKFNGTCCRFLWLGLTRPPNNPKKALAANRQKNLERTNY